MKYVKSGIFAVALAAGGAAEGSAQIHVTPSIGAYIPASDLKDLRTQADQTKLNREGTLGLGLNIEMGMLRGSIAYASGAKITDEGVQNQEELGDGSLLAAAVDIVVRPLPRLFIQPYVLGGVGFKRLDYSYNEDGIGTNPLPENERDLTLHAGVGADLMFGPIGIMAEVSDFISKDQDDKWGMHDAFVQVGLRLRLGGN